MSTILPNSAPSPGLTSPVATASAMALNAASASAAVSILSSANVTVASLRGGAESVEAELQGDWSVRELEQAFVVEDGSERQTRRTNGTTAQLIFLS